MLLVSTLLLLVFVADPAVGVVLNKNLLLILDILPVIMLTDFPLVSVAYLSTVESPTRSASALRTDWTGWRYRGWQKHPR